jgi:hypothetical protein
VGYLIFQCDKEIKPEKNGTIDSRSHGCNGLIAPEIMVGPPLTAVSNNVNIITNSYEDDFQK